MGNLMSNPMKAVMEENMKKQFEFQNKSFQLQVERQIQMQVQMRSRMMAQQLAMGRELFSWWAAFYGVALVVLSAGAKKMRNPAVLVPMIPLTFVIGYQYDMTRGNKIERILAEADNIIANEQNKLTLPGPPLNFKLIENGAKKARQAN